MDKRLRTINALITNAILENIGAKIIVICKKLGIILGIILQ